MHYDISFPNLGITFDHVGKVISLHGFDIAYYGIIIGTAIMKKLNASVEELMTFLKNMETAIEEV